mgnify:CR=1 FL=1
MIIEQINKPGNTEFAKICMKWLKSGDQTLTVKNRNGNEEEKVTYFRITLKELDYIYAAPEKNVCMNPDIVGVFMKYKGIYSPAEKICVSNDFIKERQALGFYEKKAAQEKFNELFEKTFLPIFVAKYGNKVTGNEDLDYPWKVATNYLQRGKEGSFLEIFYELIKETKLDNWIYENLHTTNPTEADQILINFVAKGQTEEAVKQFIEKALTACEEETPHIFTGKYEKFMYFLKEAKGIYKAVKAYCPTEDEKLTRSMCEAYNTFFKDEVPPRKIKITVRGTNEKRTFRYEKAGIDVEGKIMTMKIDPDQLTYPFRAFVLNSLSHISDFTSKDVPVMKNYKGRIELPFIPIQAKDILKIEYSKKIIWKKPEKETI